MPIIFLDAHVRHVKYEKCKKASSQRTPKKKKEKADFTASWYYTSRIFSLSLSVSCVYKTNIT